MTESNLTTGIKIVIPQQSWASGVSAALAPTKMVRGKCEQIVVEINDNTGDKTLTLTITNADGATLFSQGAIPENAKTVYYANSNKATQDANFNAFLADELCTFTMTPSGDPSTSGMTADVAIYVDPLK